MRCKLACFCILCAVLPGSHGAARRTFLRLSGRMLPEADGWADSSDSEVAPEIGGVDGWGDVTSPTVCGDGSDGGSAGAWGSEDGDHAMLPSDLGVERVDVAETVGSGDGDHAMVSADSGFECAVGASSSVPATLTIRECNEHSKCVASALISSVQAVLEKKAPDGEGLLSTYRQFRLAHDQLACIENAASAAIIQLVDHLPADKDDAGKRIATELLGNKHIASAVTMAEKLGVDRDKVLRERHVFSSALMCLHRSEAVTVMKATAVEVVERGGTNLTLHEFQKLDESPQRLRVADALRLNDSHGRQTSQIEKRITDICVADPVLGKPTVDTSTGTKLLQLRSVYVLLCRIGDTYAEFHFRIFHPPTAMKATSSEVYLQICERERLCVDEVAAMFQRHNRTVDSDGDGAIQKMVRIAKIVQPNVHFLHLLCSLHVASGDKEDVALLVEGLKTCFTHSYLWLHWGNNVSAFRQSCRRVLSRRAEQITCQRVSRRQVTANLTFLFSLYPGRSLKNRAEQLFLAESLPGNWKDKKGCIQIKVTEGGNAEEALDQALDKVTRVLIGSGPMSFPSRNWIHFEKTPQWIARMSSVHNLFEDTVIDYFFTHHPEELEALRPRTAGRHDGPALAMLMPPANDVDGDTAYDDVGDEPVPEAEGAAANLAEASGGSEAVDHNLSAGGASVSQDLLNAGIAKEDDIWKARYKAQKNWRKTVLRWVLSGNVSGDSTMCAVVFRLHSSDIAQRLSRSGKKYSKEVEKSDREAHANGTLNDKWTCRLADMYESKLEDHLETEAHAAMSNTRLWEAMPPHARTKARQSKTFCMLAMTATKAHCNRFRNKSYPLKFFGGLKNMALWKEIDDEPCKKRYGPWLTQMKDHYGQLHGNMDAEMDGRTIGTHAHGETGEVEHGHGSMRRYITVRSSQTHALDLQSLQDDWAFKMFREVIDELKIKCPPGSDEGGSKVDESHEEGEVHGSSEGAEDDEDDGPIHCRALSAWNVFTHVKLRGRGCCVRRGSAELRTEFNRMRLDSSEEYRRYVAVAKKATEARNAGNKQPLGSFVAEVFGRSPDDDMHASPDAVAGPPPSEPFTLVRFHDRAVTAQELKAAARAEAAKNRVAEQDELEATQRFYSDTGGPIMVAQRELSELLPDCCGSANADSDLHVLASAAPKLKRLQWLPKQSVKAAKALMHRKATNNHIARVYGVIQAVGQGKALTVLPRPLPVIDPGPIKFRQRACFSAGRCLCNQSDNSLEVALFGSNLEAAIRNAVSDKRQRLKAATIVVLLGSLPIEDEGLLLQLKRHTSF